MYGCKRDMEAVMAPYKEVYKDVHKKTKQSNVMFFPSMFSLSCFAMYPTLFDHPVNFHFYKHQHRCLYVY